MALVKLAGSARRSLRAIVRQSGDAREVKRAQALLWLHAGQHVNQVAQQVGVRRRTVERWAERFCERQAAPVRASGPLHRVVGRLLRRLRELHRNPVRPKGSKNLSSALTRA